MDADYHQTPNTYVMSDENLLINPQGSTITFHALNYTLTTRKCCNICPLPCVKKQDKRILYDINGIFKPGMNAILGPTGSGKSSLLDILADRKDRKGLEGQVLLDGQVQTDDFKYRVGYVVQDDIVSGTLTVRENLAFSANLRLSTQTSRQQKKTIIDQVIEQLGLEKCADTKVGTEFTRGISGGERKRTNIGMELVLSPSVLFLDEPTTGKLFLSKSSAEVQEEI
jgi:ATP-binding cassette subfamily G (WHITE) protein 2